MSFAAPRLAAASLTRRRLLDRLDAAGPLVVLRAPAGAGKSTVLAQWVELVDEPVLWCRPVDLEDPDRYLRRVARELAVAGVIPAELTETPGLSLGKMLDAIQQPVTFVLEDAHQWPLRLRSAIARALNHNDIGRVRLIVSGWECAPFDAAELVGRRPPAVIDLHELDFTESECVELCQRAGGVPREDAVRAVWARVGGFPRTLAFVTSTLAGLPPRISVADAVDRVAERARLVAAELTARTDPVFEQFLRDTAEADELDLDLAEELAAPAEARALLNRCIELGVGTWVGPLAGFGFAFAGGHRLAWRARAREVDPQRAVDRAERVARWSVRSGEPWTALRIAVDHGDLLSAESVIRADLAHVLAHRGAELRALLEPLPLHQLQRLPFVAFGLAIQYNAEGTHRLRAMELFLAAAIASRAQLSQAEGIERAELLTVDGSVRRVSGKVRPATEVAQAALAELEGLTPLQQDQERHRLGPLFTSNGISLLYGGRPQEALAAFGSAFGGARQAPLEAFHGGALAAGAHALRGDVQEAERLVAALDSRGWPSFARGYTGTFLEVARAVIALERGELAAASAAVADLDGEIPTSEHAALIIGVQALVDWYGGRPEVGLERLAEARSKRPGRAAGPLVDDLLLGTEVALHLAAGSPHRAVALLSRRGVRTAVAQLAEARIALVLDDPRRALDLAAAADEPTTPRLRAERMALRTAAGLRLVPGSSAGADELLAVLHIHGLSTPLLALPQEDLDRIADVIPDRLPRATLVSLVRPVDVIRLTPKEQVILAALVETGSAARIAERTFTSVSTVKSQQAALYRKLGVNNRQAALVRARELALLDDAATH